MGMSQIACCLAAASLYWWMPTVCSDSCNVGTHEVGLRSKSAAEATPKSHRISADRRMADWYVRSRRGRRVARALECSRPRSAPRDEADDVRSGDDSDGGQEE